MSEKDKGFRIQLSEKERDLVERICKETGLTAKQGIELAILHFFKKHDTELFEKAKQYVNPEVLRVLEKEV